MTNIQEQIYMERLKASPEIVQKYIYGIQTNNSFDVYLAKYRGGITDKEERTDTLKNEISLLLLRIITIDEFVDKAIETLDIHPSEAEEMIADLFSICLSKDLQDIVEHIDEETGKGDSQRRIEIGGGVRVKESDSISHVDILSEIENPTPSLKTTSLAQSAHASSNTQTQKTAATGSSLSSTTPSGALSNHPAQPHQTGLGGFGTASSSSTATQAANPAQNIATKLDQKMTASSTSTPKEVYVSKKPDPYHEPFI